MGEIRLGEPDDQVVVVVHQAVSGAGPPIALDDTGKDLEEEPSVAVVLEDAIAPIASCRNVVRGAGDLSARAAGHLTRLNDDGFPMTDGARFGTVS